MTGVGVYIIRNNRVLLANRSDGRGWCGAGGKVEYGESRVEAIVRETAEEFNLRVYPQDLEELFTGVVQLGTNGDNGQPIITKVSLYTTRLFSGEFKICDREFTEYGWFSRDQLKDIELFPPATVALEIMKWI